MLGVGQVAPSARNERRRLDRVEANFVADIFPVRRHQRIGRQTAETRLVELGEGFGSRDNSRALPAGAVAEGKHIRPSGEPLPDPRAGIA